VTEDLLTNICGLYLRVVSVAMYSDRPRTLIHNDVHGDNLLVAEDGEQSLAILDWLLTTPARPGPDLAGFLVGYLDTSERRRHENRLLEMYYSVLIQHGITGYSFEQCWDDYRMRWCCQLATSPLPLPKELRRLSMELARMDAVLDDPVFFAPVRAVL
jgi:hypothetical protein